MYKSSIILVLTVITTLPFISCEPEDEPDTCKNCAVVYKPNIYLYPTETTDLAVTLGFPMGGSVIASIPEYNTGWSVSVETDGTIDGKYGFLFYESEQADIWQRSEGWTIAKADLASFFTANMYNYGFNENEVKDFIDYWIPRLRENAYYRIYPQTTDLIKAVITLNISKKPDKIMRLFYVIQGIDEKQAENSTVPNIPSNFSRNGFVVMEWGVVLDS